MELIILDVIMKSTGWGSVAAQSSIVKLFELKVQKIKSIIYNQLHKTLRYQTVICNWNVNIEPKIERTWYQKTHE